MSDTTPPAASAQPDAKVPQYQCVIEGCPGNHESKWLMCNAPTPPPAREAADDREWCKRGAIELRRVLTHYGDNAARERIAGIAARLDIIAKRSALPKPAEPAGDVAEIVAGLRAVAIFFAADADYADYKKHRKVIDRAIAALQAVERPEFAHCGCEFEWTADSEPGKQVGECTPHYELRRRAEALQAGEARGLTAAELEAVAKGSFELADKAARLRAAGLTGGAANCDEWAAALHLLATNRACDTGADQRRMIEVVYTWPDGREEVRYLRVAGSDEANAKIAEVSMLQATHGKECPYSWRVCGSTPSPSPPSQELREAAKAGANALRIQRMTYGDNIAKQKMAERATLLDEWAGKGETT